MIDHKETIDKNELKGECGVAEVSIKRALWFKQNGWKITKIYVSGKNTMEVEIDVSFCNKEKDCTFTFTGFSIGYHGTSPIGFRRFLKLFEINWEGFDPMKNKVGNGPYTWSE